ncbi:unnamed protein product [Prorocentrum cordatum]|uniref:Uncharacterized protein n=1 Tax=Prorocentrum cordatum TaxID=2364126 RepID=A0ABN9R7H7_9DINO|nr:unnamed protein product [Polarella glacialis]
MEEGDRGRGGGSSEDEERTTSQRSKFCTPARRATRRRVRPCAPLVRQQTCPALHLQGFTAEEAEEESEAEEEEEEEEEVIFPPRSLARLGPVRRGGRARRREVRSLSGRSAGAAPGGPRQAGPPPSREQRISSAKIVTDQANKPTLLRLLQPILMQGLRQHQKDYNDEENQGDNYSVRILTGFTAP